jgi:hypothetical protein
MKMQEQDYFKEMTKVFGEKTLKPGDLTASSTTKELEGDIFLQRESPDLLVKFFKILNELTLDFNIGIFITGVENLYSKGDQNRFRSFILLLRSCSLFIPSFVKIVLTMEQRPSKQAVCDKIT